MGKLILLVAALSWGAVDLINMPVNTWMQIPNTHLRSVAPSASQYPNIQGIEGAAAIINDWVGGTFDTKRNRLIVWGGGHNGYYGNEVYAFDVGAQQWSRITNPTANPNFCSDGYSDGTPSSKHTYGTNAYIAHADRMFNSGGGNACPQGACGNTQKVFTLDFPTSAWHNMSPSGTGPHSCCDDFATYDPLTRKVYYFDVEFACGNYSTAGLYSYDYTNNQWAKVMTEYISGYCIVDTKRHLLFAAGRDANSADATIAYDLTKTPPTRQAWTTTGAPAGFVSQAGIGLAYDSIADKYVGWKGGAVYVLDPDTKVWTSNNPAGGPPSGIDGVSRGVWGRWQYVPSVNAYLTVVSVDSNVYAYKLTAGMGAGVERRTLAAAPVLKASPNPFRTSLNIVMSGRAAGKQDACIEVYDVQGKKVYETLTEKEAVTWDAGGLPSGIYLIKADVDGKTISRRISLLK
jgi:hypothetical protein